MAKSAKETGENPSASATTDADTTGESGDHRSPFRGDPAQ